MAYKIEQHIPDNEIVEMFVPDIKVPDRTMKEVELMALHLGICKKCGNKADELHNTLEKQIQVNKSTCL